MPQGFAYHEGALSPAQERGYVEQFAGLPFAPFEFHGFLGRRRIVSFGWRYDYASRQLRPATEPPAFLAALRGMAALAVGVDTERLQQILVTEYTPGAAIGWHRDKPMFEDVVAVSFLAPCLLRFRRRQGDGWERRSIEVSPRSVYLLRGAARREWQHSIPPVDSLRYSVTFRTFVSEPEPGQSHR